MCAQAVTTECHRLGGSNNRLFSHSSGGWKFEVGESAGSVSSEASSWLTDGLFLSVFSHGLLSARMHAPGVQVFSNKDIAPHPNGSASCRKLQIALVGDFLPLVYKPVAPVQPPLSTPMPPATTVVLPGHCLQSDAEATSPHSQDFGECLADHEVTFPN